MRVLCGVVVTNWLTLHTAHLEAIRVMKEIKSLQIQNELKRLQQKSGLRRARLQHVLQKRPGFRLAFRSLAANPMNQALYLPV